MTPREAIFVLQGNIDLRARVFGPDDSGVKTARELREVIELLVAEVQTKNKTIANLEKQIMELNDAAIESEGF